MILLKSSGGGRGVWLLFWRPITISDPIYAIFPIPFHFLNQCSREKMKNKQTKNKTKQKQIDLKLSSFPYFRLERLKSYQNSDKKGSKTPCTLCSRTYKLDV